MAEMEADNMATEMTPQLGLADQFFNAYRQSKVLEGELERAVLSVMGKDPEDPDNWGFDDFLFDDYDASFELRGCIESFVLTEGQKSALRAMGFIQCWFCEKPPGEYDKGVYVNLLVSQ